MDAFSPPTSARSCSSMASDLIGEDRHSLTFADNSFRRRGVEHGEDDMDMVFENFFGLHNVIDDIESSLTSGTPKVSPRPEEYSSFRGSPKVSPRPEECPSISDQLSKHSVSKYATDDSPMAMNLAANTPDGVVQLTPASLESKAYLKNMHDSQQYLFQHKTRLRKKIITLQVSIAVFEEEPEPGPGSMSTHFAPSDMHMSALMPPPVRASGGQQVVTQTSSHQQDNEGAVNEKAKSKSKGKDKDKDKSKRTNMMRHIYKTKCNAYRVQISVGSKINPNGKFSRNTRQEKDALWLCELAILFIHHPTSVDYLLHWGNYDYLLTCGFCSSYEDYVSCLMKEFVELTGRGLIKPVEFDSIRAILASFFVSSREHLEALDIANIQLADKKGKMAASPSLALNDTATLRGESNNGAVAKSLLKKSTKVVIPVLQLPASSIMSPITIARDKKEVLEEGTDSTWASVEASVGMEAIAAGERGRARGGDHGGPHLQGPYLSQTTTVDSDCSRDGSGTDADSKRRRVPAINPTHQSPRTIEIFLQQRQQYHQQQQQLQTKGSP